MQILYACGRSIARISECVNLDLLVMVNTFELEIQPHANGVKSLTWDIKGSSFTIGSQNLVFGSELDSSQYYCNIVMFTQLHHNLLRVCLYLPIIQLGSSESVSVRLLRIPLAFVCFQNAIALRQLNDIQFVREILTCYAWLSLPVTLVILVIGFTLAV